MIEEKKFIITFNGKEVKPEQLLIRTGEVGEKRYYLANKKVSVVFHSNGCKNIVVVENRYGNIIWQGTFELDLQFCRIDIVEFTDNYMRRLNCASVMDTAGRRYQVPKFNYFETPIIPEPVKAFEEEEEETEVPATTAEVSE